MPCSFTLHFSPCRECGIKISNCYCSCFPNWESSCPLEMKALWFECSKLPGLLCSCARVKRAAGTYLSPQATRGIWYAKLVSG